MLILTRKAGESLYIGDDIKITLISVQGKQARIGINLPDTMTVYREEVYKRVMQDNITAGQRENKELTDDTTYSSLVGTRVGNLKLDKDKFIAMPKGLIGYEEEKEYTIIEYKENSPFYIYQSTKTPDFGVLITDPYFFMNEYTVKLSEAEQALLEADSAEDVNVFVTVIVPHGRPEDITLNLSGPIFINYKKRLAIQVPQDITPTRVLLRECIEKLQSETEA